MRGSGIGIALAVLVSSPVTVLTGHMGQPREVPVGLHRADVEGGGVRERRDAAGIGARGRPVDVGRRAVGQRRRMALVVVVVDEPIARCLLGRARGLGRGRDVLA